MNQALQIHSIDGIDLIESVAEDEGTSLERHAKSSMATEIRTSVKAQRLERLLARQLENQLEDTSLLEHLNDETEGVSGQIVEIKQTQLSCSDILEKIRHSSNTLAEVTQHATEIDNYVRRIEAEFIEIKKAEANSERINAASAKLEQEHQRALAIIEKQKNHIKLLEILKKANLENFEAAQLTIEELEAKNKEISTCYNETLEANSVLEKEKISLSAKIDSLIAEQNIANTNSSLELDAGYGKDQIHELEADLMTTRARLQEREHSLAKLQTEFDATTKLLILHEEMVSSLKLSNEGKSGSS